MKNIALIWAGGFVGDAVLNEALERGFKVRAVVRNPEKVRRESPHLEVVKGDAMKTGELADILKGEKIAISAYNPGWNNPHICEDTLEGYRSIIEAAKRAGLSRLLIAGGAGSLYVKPGLTLLESGGVPEPIAPSVGALAEVLNSMLEPDRSIDWVFLSPSAYMFDGKRTGKFRIGKDDMLFDENGDSKISVQDFACAMMDEAENPRHHFERFTVGY